MAQDTSVAAEDGQTETAAVALVSRSQAGDRTADDELLERYLPLLAVLVGQAQPLVRPGVVAPDDLWQEAYRQFFALVRAFRCDSAVAFGHYLKQKLRWRLANYLRAERLRQSCVVPLTAEHFKLAGKGHRGYGDPGSPRLRAAYAQLSPKQRNVLNRLHVQNLKVAQIAAEYGITSQAVTALRRRAEERLRKLLAEQE